MNLADIYTGMVLTNLSNQGCIGPHGIYIGIVGLVIIHKLISSLSDRELPKIEASYLGFL
jgi:hypothetical protein